MVIAQQKYNFRINPPVKDSSAAAIACSGLLALSRLNERREFKEVALKILDSLSVSYLNKKGDGILKNGCFHKPKNMGVNESLMWGDYYFVEALTGVLEKEDKGNKFSRSK